MSPHDPATGEPTNQSDDFDTRVRGIAALSEPIRRDLYRYVASQPGSVSRDETCTAT